MAKNSFTLEQIAVLIDADLAAVESWLSTNEQSYDVALTFCRLNSRSRDPTDEQFSLGSLGCAFKQRRIYDSVKAAVSQKKEYNRGVEIFKKGDASYSMMGFEAAYNYYSEACDIFEQLYVDIFDKRAAALAAIEAAKKSVEESAAVAEEADLEAPLTGDVDGIEDEDAVLLEEDDYADPEDAEEYLSEDISIGGDAK